MPTVTYNYEPTDQVYVIDYCKELKVETVVKGTIYRVDVNVKTKEVVAVAGVAQVPSDAAIAASDTAAATALTALTAAQDALALDPGNATLIADVAAAQTIYDGHVNAQVITTPAVTAVTGVPATFVVKYILRTSYSESVSIDDEALIFPTKTAAFDALVLRTA